MLSWWLDSTELSMQENVYKIIVEGTALGGQNCWDSVKPLEYQTAPYKPHPNFLPPDSMKWTLCGNCDSLGLNPFLPFNI